ncbi:MAG TPA: M28 family peptidase [Pilimelia sp.]|nr:M28 family peptidase [Pilimelia sp.]
MTRVRTAVAVTAIAAVLAPAAAAQAARPSPAGLADRLVRAVTLDGVNRHLIALQRFADRNGGHRAVPSRGYEETVEYIERTMRAAGFAVQVQQFSYDRPVVDRALVAAGAVRVESNPMVGAPDTPVGGVTGPLVVIPADDDSGCQAGDYAGRVAAGAVVLVKRGGCTYTQKQVVAAEAGARALVVYNHSVGATGGYTDPAVTRIPVVMVGSADGAALVGQDGAATTLEVRRHTEPTVARNVIAQTRTGRTDNVIMLGGHADSTRTSPGINDNGTSAAVMLEVARQLGGAPRITNAVRFSFWGADPQHSGSVPYLRSLSFEQQLDIALYLDIAQLGSSNGGHFVFDGDNSAGQAGPMPYGSAQIERAFVDYLAGIGVPTEEAPVVGQGAYAVFIGAGIPTGGPFSGIPHIKTAAQVAKWGGTAGIALEPCNHAPCDNLGNVNRRILDRNADAVAHVTGGYAWSTEDVNGVPPRTKRAAARQAARHAAAPGPRAAPLADG